MVVEDEPEIYELLLAMFEMWGIEGVAFIDGEEAVAWIEDVDNGRFKGELPELCLLDIRLPGELQGDAVGERLRASPVLGKSAVVFTTGWEPPAEDKEEYMRRAAADAWIGKPLPKFGELKGELEDILAKRRAMNAAQREQADTATPPSGEQLATNGQAKPAKKQPPVKSEQSPDREK